MVEFVNYANAASGIIVRKGNPSKVSVTSLCGKTIAASEGSALADQEEHKSSQRGRGGSFVFR